MAAIPSLLAGVKVHPTCFLAFDLPNTEFAPVLRAYLFPHRTAGLGEMSTAVTVFEAVRHLPSPTHEILPVLGKIEAFLSAHQDNSVGQLGLQNSRRSGGELKARGLSVEMLSFDCVDPSTARIKIYAKTHDTSFISVKNAFTLGGQLNSSGTAEGLKALEEFWRCLMLLREDWDDDEDQSAEFLYFGFEIAPGRNDPDIKLYVPSWTCGIDKTGLTRGLSKYFKEKGWSVASSYKSDIREIL
jgi:DMATS type aromatic prenyltransferase